MRLNRGRWTPTTQERYFQIVRDYIIPHFGKVPIGSITRARVKQELAEIAQIRSAKTVELFMR